MPHKIFHINKKKLGARFDKLQIILNIPVIAGSLALVIIVNVVMRVTEPPLELYRAVFGAVFVLALYSFSAAFITTVMAAVSVSANSKYTFIEISGGAVIFSQHEKTVRIDGEKIEYVKMWVMRLCDIEDAFTRKEHIVVKGKARYFCLPANWLNYTVNSSGKIEFERWWNDVYGGENVTEVNIRDIYTFGERIVKRILLCAEKERIDEQRRAEFRRRMLELAGSISKKKGLTLKYKDPPSHLPREGIKNRKW